MSSASSTVTYTSVDTDSKPGRAFWPADKELSDRGSPGVIVYGYVGLPIQPVAPPSPDYIPGLEDPHALLVPQDEDERYVADSNPEEDSEEEHADYPTDGGDDDDDDDTDDEDEDPFKEEEKEEHLALADPSDVPVVDPAPILLPPEEEVERLLALPTPPPSPLISLSPPSAEERLARCLAAPALPSSPLPRLPHPYGSPNHVRAPPGFRAAMGRLRASSPLPPPVPATLPLPSPPLPPLPSSPLPPLPDSLFIPPVDRREDIPEAELPPRKRLCLTTPASRYEVGESSTAVPRPTGGRRVDYGFVGTLDAEARRQRAEAVGYGIRDTWVDPRETAEEVAPVTLEGVNTRVTELAAVQEQDTQDIYAVIEDTQDRQTQIHQTVEALVDDRQYHYETARLLDQEALLAKYYRAAATYFCQLLGVASCHRMTAAAVEQLVADRASTSLANHDTLRNSTNGHGDGSHNSGTGTRGATRTPQMPLLGGTPNKESRLHKGSYGMDWKALNKFDNVNITQELALMCGRMFPEESDEVEKYVSGLPDMIRGNMMSYRPQTMKEVIEFANDQMNQKLITIFKRQAEDIPGKDMCYLLAFWKPVLLGFILSL
ncbi:hypothetical protein Tco_1387084 [Tanacetum coccineum]